MRLVLLHGIGVGPDYLRPLARELSPHEVELPTLPGWRGNKTAVRTLDLDELGDAIAPLLPGAIVANSLGCQVAVELVIRRPALVSSLVLIGPTVDPHQRPLARMLGGFALDCAREPPALWAIIARDYLAMGPRRFAVTARHAWTHHMEERLPLVQQPTLIVRGGRDGFVSQRWCEEAAALLPAGRLVTVTGEPHAVHFTAPRIVAQEVEQHLGEG